jgi:hypothetical protein
MNKFCHYSRRSPLGISLAHHKLHHLHTPLTASPRQAPMQPVGAGGAGGLKPQAGPGDTDEGTLSGRFVYPDGAIYGVSRVLEFGYICSCNRRPVRAGAAHENVN